MSDYYTTRPVQVKQFTQKIEINEADGSVDIVSAGPAGPPGPPGEGGQTISYEFVQAISASSWLINHNMNYRPAVTVIDSGGDVIIPHIIHHSADQLELQFNTPRAGTAYLS